MPFFFKSKQTVPIVSIEDNIFSRQLPIKLYLFLKQHGLLDQKPHVFQTTNAGINVKAIMMIEADERGRANFTASISIRVEKKCDGDGYKHDLFVFADKIWLMSMSDEWSVNARGNAKVCGYNDDVFSDAKCIKKTPREVDFIIDRLTKLIVQEQPVPVERCNIV